MTAGAAGLQDAEANECDLAVKQAQLRNRVSEKWLGDDSCARAERGEFTWAMGFFGVVNVRGWRWDGGR